jgi:hypothetical protein
VRLGFISISGIALAEEEFLLIRLNLEAFPAVPASDNVIPGPYLMVAKRAGYGTKALVRRKVALPLSVHGSTFFLRYNSHDCPIDPKFRHPQNSVPVAEQMLCLVVMARA